MSTPSSKPPVRWHVKGRPGDDPILPMGTYNPGLAGEPFQRLLGEFAAEWPHIESVMIWVFAAISDISDHSIAVQMFRSIINQQTRITIMTNILERSPTHVKFDDWYDEVIAEFKSINRSRNKYIHSLWWTHESGRVFIQEDAVHHRIGGELRETKINELRNTLRRMRALVGKIHDRFFSEEEP
jgi:hypothetical protein